MASLKCSNCGYGIRYHDEPCGIEYTLIPIEVWDNYLNKDKTICRIILDIPNSYLTVWKCPECGCLHLFDGVSIRLKSIYVPAQNNDIEVSGEKYCVFDDFTFENVADNDITPNEYENSGNFQNQHYAIIGETGIAIYKDKELSCAVQSYKKEIAV